MRAETRRKKQRKSQNQTTGTNKDIERKIHGPSTPINFFRFGFLKHRMIERDTEREPQIVETRVFLVGTTCMLHRERLHTHYPINGTENSVDCVDDSVVDIKCSNLADVTVEKFFDGSQDSESFECFKCPSEKAFIYDLRNEFQL